MTSAEKQKERKNEINILNEQQQWWLIFAIFWVYNQSE